MERMNLRKNRGITLIALIITIIVMLILAGVTINLTLGENGIFRTAQKAAKNYTDAQNKEMADLNNFTNLINNTVEGLGNGNTGNREEVTPKPPVTLPENTPTIPSGTLVQKPADKTWDETKINSYADGIGNTIPVPVGFSPITTLEGQGTKDTGFVIKNNADGNEFVWIPVGSEENYQRIAWNDDEWIYKQEQAGMDSTTSSVKIIRPDLNDNTLYWTEKMPIDEKDSISMYGGFYMGRYESGIEGGEIGDTLTDGTYYTGANMKLAIKSGQKVWNYITINKAKTVATELYNKETNNAYSKLCSSYAWDSALKFIQTQNTDYPINSIGGNYSVESEGTGELQLTGYHKVNNIYDMGGNAWDWTTETFSNTSSTCTVRGGHANLSASGDSAASRGWGNENDAFPDITFRVTLFM